MLITPQISFFKNFKKFSESSPILFPVKSKVSTGNQSLIGHIISSMDDSDRLELTIPIIGTESTERNNSEGKEEFLGN